MTLFELQRIIAGLPAITPLSDKYERQLAPQKRKRVWYRSQKEHWMGWLREYHTPGAYGRTPNFAHDAETVWNRLQCVGMLIWMAEAVRIDPKVLNAALKASQSVMSNSAACGRFRAHVPWQHVALTLSQRHCK